MNFLSQVYTNIDCVKVSGVEQFQKLGTCVSVSCAVCVCVNEEFDVWWLFGYVLTEGVSSACLGSEYVVVAPSVGN